MSGRTGEVEARCKMWKGSREGQKLISRIKSGQSLREAQVTAPSKPPKEMLTQKMALFVRAVKQAGRQAGYKSAEN